MEKNKTSRYLKYAIGEIILVVIGILIALQVSNWNQDRIEANIINSYCLKLEEELNQELIYYKDFLKQIQELREKQIRCLTILKTNEVENLDELKANLGAFGTGWTSQISMEIFDEFKEKGFLSNLKDSELKEKLKTLNQIILKLNKMDEYIATQYDSRIEGFFNLNINYSEVAMERYKSGLIQGGPVVDYSKIYNNLEAWNIFTLKLETTNLQIRDLKKFIEIIEDLRSYLEQTITNS